MRQMLIRNRGSFRDPANQVYEVDNRILRGVDQYALDNFKHLQSTKLYEDNVRGGNLVATRAAEANDKSALAIIADGWRGVLLHDRVPLISYPYEWTFSQLKDAALLQLKFLESGFAEGLTLKDATPYNVQFAGTKEIFIDIPSFVSRTAGEPWLGYRQFCMMYLYPLLLKAHLDVSFQPILRSMLDGISPYDVSRYFYGLRCFKRGVLSHVVIPARLEERATHKKPANVTAARHHSQAMVLGLIQSMRRLVEQLNFSHRSSVWSDYVDTHSYDDHDMKRKLAFVERSAKARTRHIVWDLGCNTGTFSRLLRRYSSYVVAIDSDEESVERLYLHSKKKDHQNILPLVMNLANISPNQGWAGDERVAFDARNKPDLVVCLAVIHHAALTSNIPIALFVSWLASLRSQIVIEFVDRQDEMVQAILRQKGQMFPDYSLDVFERELNKHFIVHDQEYLKEGRRGLYFADPR